MFTNLLARIGLGAVRGLAQSATGHAPYAEAHVNFLYNSLFCDSLALFRRQNIGADEEPWLTLFAAHPAEAALRRIADGWSDESRVRALAFRRLRDIGAAVAPKILLGVIVEVPLQCGLDVLAAYSDGRVRYINQTGRISIFEGGPAVVETLARELIVAALPLVQRTAPSDGARLPPPRAACMRITFLVSDGLHSYEGSFEQLRADALGAALLGKATQLLDAVVDSALHPR